MQSYEIRTSRLHLKAIDAGAAPDLYAITKDNHKLCEFMTWDPPKSLEEVATGIEKELRADSVLFGVYLDKELIGKMVLRNFHWWQHDAQKASVFLSFWIIPEHAGKGYGTEMLRGVCDFCFRILKLKKIFAGCFTDNIASQKLLEKVGFVKIGILRKQFIKNGKEIDSVRYELLIEDFIG